MPKLKNGMTVLFWLVNGMLLLVLANLVIGGNDKAPVAFVLGYGVIFTVNLLLWITLKLLGSAFARTVGRYSIVLTLLFFIVLAIVISS